ncbi:MAG: peptidylprolyl isomerase [bacterium]|nr:peptidylprolyl isomerase [bacterium]
MTSRTHVVLALIFVLAALIVLSSIVAYGTNFDDPLTRNLKKIYPAIIVRDRVISVFDLEKAIEIGVSLDKSAEPKTIRDQLIKQKKMEILVRKLRIGYGSQNVTNEFLFTKAGKNVEYLTLITDHFSGHEKLFEKFVVTSETLDALLRIRYNSDFSQNSVAYNRIMVIQRQLQEGESFEDLAKEKSADQLTGQFGGDLGFFNESEIVPELASKITVASLGEVLDQIVVSRFGYHLLYPVETAEVGGQKVWQAKHILVETEGYDDWLESQIENLPVWTIFTI